MNTALVRAAVGTAVMCFALCIPVGADELPNGAGATKSGSGVLEDRRRAQLVVEPRDLDREIVLKLPRAMNPESAGHRAAPGVLGPRKRCAGQTNARLPRR